MQPSKRTPAHRTVEAPTIRKNPSQHIDEAAVMRVGLDAIRDRMIESPTLEDKPASEIFALDAIIAEETEPER